MKEEEWRENPLLYKLDFASRAAPETI